MTYSKTATELVTFAGEPSIEPFLIECKFTVESISECGEKRVTFEGYATGELYMALMDAMRKVVGDD